MYSARIEQTGRNLLVRLSGAAFLLRSGSFSGFVSPTGETTFAISEADNYYYSFHELVERVSESTALFVTGGVTTRATGPTIVAPLSGKFTLMQGVAAPFTQTLGSCVSNSHRFELVRQYGNSVVPARLHRMTVATLATMMLLGTAFVAACSAPKRPRNLLLITLDTMRADPLPPYGFSGVETSALDRLAAEGAVFEQTFAAVPLTLPSHASLFTGLYPPRLAVRDNAGAPLAAEFTTLSERLRQQGLTTAAFVASAVLAPGRGLEQGFDVYSDGSQPGCPGGPRARRRADQVVDEAVQWLARRRSEPFFAWIHLFDTHRPYLLPADFSRRYSDPYLAAIAFEDSRSHEWLTIWRRAIDWTTP